MAANRRVMFSGKTRSYVAIIVTLASALGCLWLALTPAHMTETKIAAVFIGLCCIVSFLIHLLNERSAAAREGRVMSDEALASLRAALDEDGRERLAEVVRPAVSQMGYTLSMRTREQSAELFDQRLTPALDRQTELLRDYLRKDIQIIANALVEYANADKRKGETRENASRQG